MKRLLAIAFIGCAFSLASMLPASAMPMTTPHAMGSTAAEVIQVRGGHGHGHGHGHGWGHHGGRGHHYGWGRGHHYGWYRGHHYGWRHHHRHWW
jgi:hypothetical protein